MDFLPLIPNAALADEFVHTLWRTNDSTILTRLIGDKSFLGKLCATVASVRPLALAVVRALDSGAPSALIGAAKRTDRRGSRVRDCLATDLLASALLIEAVAGDPAARVAVDHLRGQRSLTQIAWPIAAPRRGRTRKVNTFVDSDEWVLPTP